MTEAKSTGCDFIKVMFSGLVCFDEYGRLSCPSLPADEIAEFVRIAHEEGFAVMVHVNGAEAVKAGVAAGTDSVKHGYFMDRECLEMLARSDTVWVPTLAAAAVLIGRSGFDWKVAQKVLSRQQDNVLRALSFGTLVAAGSDSGAFGVPHGEGTLVEYRLLHRSQDVVQPDVLERRIVFANENVRCRFRRG